jgi:hypothetical protein
LDVRNFPRNQLFVAISKFCDVFILVLLDGLIVGFSKFKVFLFKWCLIGLLLVLHENCVVNGLSEQGNILSHTESTRKWFH